MSPCFFQIFRFDSGSSIKLLSSKIENMFLLSMVRFYPGKHTLPEPIQNVSTNAAVPASPNDGLSFLWVWGSIIIRGRSFILFIVPKADHN